MQVAVKRLHTSQVSAEDLTQFKIKLQSLAFASSMCHKVCRLLGFVVLDGNLYLVMRKYPQSLTELLASPEGMARTPHSITHSLCMSLSC